MKKLLAVLLSLGALIAAPAHAALNVLACEPEWAALTQELTGGKANVTSATTAMQDPHRIEARPALLAQARRADLVVCSGADLEIGWLPLLQRESGNAKIQPGQPGYFEAAAFVRLIEKPAVLDRALGDIHAAGNPHFFLDPRNLLKVSDALAKRLADIDPPNAAHYVARHKDFSARMQAAIARWEKEAAPLTGVPVVVQHKNWSYLADWLGLKVVADLEPKPGVDPSAAYLGQLLDKLKTQPAKMVLRAAYQSPKASEWIAERAGMKAVMLPYTVGGSGKAQDLFSLFDDTLARLKEAAR
ncbi:MAG: zinc ABC transporter substrate-binding protein [Rhodocyclaceae bacterium]|nr:zinc ABC transporter substrate-binding protein [Rhodocyclaceae bacterium]